MLRKSASKPQSLRVSQSPCSLLGMTVHVARKMVEVDEAVDVMMLITDSHDAVPYLNIFIIKSSR
jgi:hypothetical protein